MPSSCTFLDLVSQSGFVIGIEQTACQCVQFEACCAAYLYGSIAEYHTQGHIEHIDQMLPQTNRFFPDILTFQSSQISHLSSPPNESSSSEPPLRPRCSAARAAHASDNERKLAQKRGRLKNEVEILKNWKRANLCQKVP